MWRSTDGGATWLPKTDDKFSLAIGALAVDPVSPNIVYAGTGEYVPGSDYGNYYGRGLLRSTNFGDSWAEIGVVDFDMAEIARIVVNPLDPANLFVAASNGLREVKPGAEIVLGETTLERGKPARLFVAVHSAKWDREQIYTFDIMQLAGGRIAGGYTVQLADLARMHQPTPGDKDAKS